MSTFIITFFALLLVIVGMSIGVLMGRAPLKGSCGGVGKALGDENYVCELCGNDESKCEEINAKNPELLQRDSTQDNNAKKQSSVSPSDLAYDASKQ